MNSKHLIMIIKITTFNKYILSKLFSQSILFEKKLEKFNISFFSSNLMSSELNWTIVIIVIITTNQWSITRAEWILRLCAPTTTQITTITTMVILYCNTFIYDSKIISVKYEKYKISGWTLMFLMWFYMYSRSQSHLIKFFRFFILFMFNSVSSRWQ